MNIKIYSDAATIDSIRLAAENPLIDGVTTNPSLLRKAGVTDYRGFVEEAVQILAGKPLSVEVVSAEPGEIYAEAVELSKWAENLFVKVPIVLPHGGLQGQLIRALGREGINLNITAVMTSAQVNEAVESLEAGCSAIISIFAGRIADTLSDPSPLFAEASRLLMSSEVSQGVELLWASTRQIFDIQTAEQAGAQIITISPDLLAKLALRGKNLDEFSRETVQMFITDAQASGLRILD